MTGDTEVTIFSRVIELSWKTLSPDAAAYFLKLDFAPRDCQRLNELGAACIERSLTSEERTELKNFVTVRQILGVFHSKARSVLHGETSPEGSTGQD